MTDSPRNLGPDLIRQLKFWSLHCGLTALPSLLIAGIYLEYFQSASRTLAMLLAILVFIASYTALTTFLKPFQEPFQEPKSVLFRSLRVALKIRMWVSFLTLVPICFGEGGLVFLLFLPDYWAGLFAGSLIRAASQYLLEGTYMDYEDANFLFVFSWTLLEGLILSFFLFMLTFFCLFIVSANQKRAWQRKVAPPRPGEITISTGTTSSVSSPTSLADPEPAAVGSEPLNPPSSPNAD